MGTENTDYEAIARRQREQMLKLVTKGFYNELINYGVRKPDILTIASHLLDNVMQQEDNPDEKTPYYNRLFTTGTVQDQWREQKRFRVNEVSIEPLHESLLNSLSSWLATPATRASFITAFPDSVEAMRHYFANPARLYFSISYQDEPVGIIGAENIDAKSKRLEMRKLVGRPDLRGKGIGKRATFAFLYYVFVILNFEKVYIHSTDVNIRNLNLNSHFGFQLEGVFLQEILLQERRQDVVRMGLMRSRWLKIFTPPEARPSEAAS